MKTLAVISFIGLKAVTLVATGFCLAVGFHLGQATIRAIKGKDIYPKKGLAH